VVERGRVKELGTHDELMALKGTYAELVALQGGANAKSPTTIDTEEVDDDGVTPPTTPAPALSKKASSHADKGAQGAGDLESISVQDPSSPTSAGAQQVNKPSVWSLSLRHWGYLSVGLIFSALLGVVFPLWGYFLANIMNVFYYIDAHELREKGSFWAGQSRHTL